jgi:hypothetical protein
VSLAIVGALIPNGLKSPTTSHFRKKPLKIAELKEARGKENQRF